MGFVGLPERICVLPAMLVNLLLNLPSPMNLSSPMKIGEIGAQITIAKNGSIELITKNGTISNFHILQHC